MHSSPETGFSTRSIIALANARAWERVEPALLRGRQLIRPVRSRYFYVDGAGGLTGTYVRKLEQEGVLRRIGVDTYVLTVAADA